MVLAPISAFDDNYIWVWHNQKQAVVVDPGETSGVEAYLGKHELELVSILVTHHHLDHTAGVAQLQATHGCSVYAPLTECRDLNALRVTEGTQLQLLGHPCRVFHVPGHTSGHVAYWIQAETDTPILFCGDTLFSAGCGRLFEGTAADMLASLEKLAHLPASTRVCCAHEYNLGNLRFALTVEPHNQALTAWQSHCQALRSRGQPTLPSTLAKELEINPFMRVGQPAVQQSAMDWKAEHANDPGATSTDATSVLAALREWKNQF